MNENQLNNSEKDRICFRLICFCFGSLALEQLWLSKFKIIFDNCYLNTIVNLTYCQYGEVTMN